MKVSTTYYPSQHGFWRWNCGWELGRVDAQGFHTISKRPLGHAEFNRLKSTFDSFQRKWIKKQRAYGDWRRMHDDLILYHHFKYGEVTLLETDGIHAVVENRHINKKWYCHFSNLTESRSHIKLTTEPKTTVKRGRPALTPWQKSATAVLKDQGIAKPTKEQVQELADQLMEFATKEKYSHLLD